MPALSSFRSLACLGAAFAASIAAAATVEMHRIDSETTSPSGTYRWLDVADQAYSIAYRGNYTYDEAVVAVTYDDASDALRGTLTALNLKPNFAYQFKLLGDADSSCNEPIGFTGRWWQQTWTGTAWTIGSNLNNKGTGVPPNPNDLVYLANRDTPDATSPTGKHYRYTAYLVFEYFITDEFGNASLSFAQDSSYHVLWKTSQTPRGVNDGPLKTTTFDVNPAIPGSAYDNDYPLVSVSVFGEWERLPIGGVRLPRGQYACQMILTEESFHGSGGTYAGSWAAAMGGDVQFLVGPELSVLSTPVSGVAITGDPAGSTNFTTYLAGGWPVTLNAPDWVASGGSDYDFARWTLNGVPQPDGQTTISFSLDDDATAVATYALRIVSWHVSLKAGDWNLVSLPIDPLDAAPATVFGPNTLTVFAWTPGDGLYFNPTTIEAKTGYWVAVSEDTERDIQGIKPATSSVYLQAGWNLVGPWDDSPVPASGVVLAAYTWEWPEGLPRYVVPNECLRGRGYWLTPREPTDVW